MKGKMLLLALVATGLLVACNPKDTPAAQLSVSPASRSVTAGDSGVTFSATLSNMAGTVQWSLQGPGQIDPTSGAFTVYTPPATLAAAGSATLTASAGSLNQTITININPSGTVPPPAVTGTLILNIAPPSGVSGFKGEVLVSGPGGFSKALSATGSLSLAPGTYTVEAKDVRKSGTIVDTVFRPSIAGAGGNPRDVAITANTNLTLDISYQVLKSTGRAWVVDWLSNMGKSYTDNQLQVATGTTNSDSSITTAAVYLNYAALDNRWNLWVSNSNRQLVEYSATDLSIIQTINVPAGGIGPFGIAFDKKGNLWAVDYFNKRILGYAKATLDLGSGGTPTPFSTIDVSNAIELFGIAFDSAGNMWVSDFGGNKIYKFDGANLSNNPAPSVTLSSKANPYAGVASSLNLPFQIAFDKDGKLWVSNSGNGTVARFDPPSGDSAPIPSLMLKDLPNARGMAFDNAGDLWVGSNTTLQKFSAAQLSANTGLVSLTSTTNLNIGVYASSIIFSPVSPKLPLYQRMK